MFKYYKLYSLFYYKMIVNMQQRYKIKNYSANMLPKITANICTIFCYYSRIEKTFSGLLDRVR